ncbi:sodium hydrogen exchanger [Stylonychia lemnae]|uniref:Sodium hydrogen exchanger n=1 Tax=Stylonychia lemnae TaxID=5949 RepID=A0A078B7F9_STYLE|nr:sodium hydrogen exchanger [Stylonychia lemnae]|eukprot:CDW89237.1 sodium hydrogen exchanger [Stylonychia lemnae]
MTIFSVLIIWMNDWEFGSLPNDQRLSNVECIVLAAVLCATDTVAALTILKEKDFPQLNAILFGEGIVNDAVSILIFETIQRQFGYRTRRQQEDISISGHDIGLAILRFCYLSIASIMIGIIIGLLSAYITKRLVNLKDHPIREIIMIFMLAYLSYIISEILNFSGIMTLFCCGFTMNHYTYYNLSKESQSGGVLAIQTISSCCEAFLFAYLGFSVISISNDNCSFQFILELLLITLVARFLSVFIPLSLLWILNYSVNFKTAVFIWYGGLIRGAIAYALTFRIDRSISRQAYLIRQNTLMIVLISTLFFGSLMSVFAKLLGISVEKENQNKKILKRFRNPSVETFDDKLMHENLLSLEEPERQPRYPLRRIHSQIIEPLDLQPENNNLDKAQAYRALRNFDQNYLKKYFGGRQTHHLEVQPQVLIKLSESASLQSVQRDQKYGSLDYDEINPEETKQLVKDQKSFFDS